MSGHKSYECKSEITYFKCGEKGHISTKCTKPKKAAGKVFALNADDPFLERIHYRRDSP